MLRTRKTYAMLDQAKGGAGSSQFGGMQALSAEHLSALSSVHIDPCFLDREKAIITANAVIAQQTAAIAAAGDPSKTDGKGKGNGLGKGKASSRAPAKAKAKARAPAPAPRRFNSSFRATKTEKSTAGRPQPRHTSLR